MLLKKVRVLAAKIETTIGTAISVSGSDGVFNVYDLEANPGTTMVERPGQGAFARLPSVQGAQWGTFKFKTDLIGGASDPAWMSTFLPACGWVGSGGAYTSTTLPPTAAGGVKTLTMSCYENGLIKKIHGAMGKFTIELIPGQPGMVSFEFQGVWDDPIDGAIIAPTYVTTKPPRFASATLTLGAFSPKVSRVTIDSGNDIYLRPDVTASGVFCACIGDRKPTITMDPESDLVADHDTYGLWKALTTAAFTCTLGATNNQISITAPSVQLTNVQESDRNGVQIDSVEFQCNKSASAGDDELVITRA